ncbi:MAG: efflux RND transporter periplasmic adaptor subunit [Limisphaerales bacterium]
MKRLIPGTLAILPTVAIAFALAGCGSKHGSTNENTTSLPVAEVRMQTVENKSRTMTDEVVGTVRAKLHATLEARLSGHIAEMPVALGEKIQKGQLIARLDAGEIAARLEQAEASLEEADRNWKRISALFEQQSVTRAEYDSAQARQRVAKGAADEAKAMMGYVEIVAPFDGVVAKKWADVGDLAAPGKPLVDIEDPSALQMEADVPDAIASHIQQDSRLGIRADSADSELTGIVNEIAPVADPNSRTFRVKLDLPPTAGLMPGQFARLAVPIGEASAIRVPAAAVVQRGQMELVFVVANGHAQLRIVKTGSRIGDEIELVSGLNSGEQVVTEGVSALTDGQPVTVKP